MTETGITTALPEEFKKRSRALFDSEEEYRRFIGALESGGAVRSLRINTLKAEEEAVDYLLSHMQLEPLSYGGGYIFKSDGIGATPLHHAGAFYVQDPGAMCAAEAVRDIVTPDFKVLDMCAAPGGKSAQLAAFLTNSGDGILVSNETDRGRASILRGNTERMGHRRSVVTNAPPQRIAEDFPAYFDLVLTDAPCSGEGMMRKYATAVSEWSEDNVKMCALRQADILDEAQKCVCPGGYLLYSTCTFSLEENEMTVDAFLSRHPEFEITEVPEKLRALTADGVNFEGCRHDMSGCRRFYPHISAGEGQFFCLMKRIDEGVRGSFQSKSAASPLTKDEKKALDSFFESVGLDTPPAVSLRGNIMLSENLPCPEYALCCGVCAGEVTKGRLVPHHHLFTAMGADFENRIELSPDSREIQAYLRGETVNIPGNMKNGWYAVTCGGCAVGGGKLVDGVLKNHYPKGLRNR